MQYEFYFEVLKNGSFYTNAQFYREFETEDEANEFAYKEMLEIMNKLKREHIFNLITVDKETRTGRLEAFKDKVVFEFNYLVKILRPKVSIDNR